MGKKLSIFAKKGDPATRAGRKAKRKIVSGIRRVKRIKKKIIIKPKKGIKKGIKRKKKSKIKLF